MAWTAVMLSRAPRFRRKPTIRYSAAKPVNRRWPASPSWRKSSRPLRSGRRTRRAGDGSAFVVYPRRPGDRSVAGGGGAAATPTRRPRHQEGNVVNTDRRAESGPTPSRAAGSSPEHAETHAGSGDDTTPLIQPPRLRTDEERTATRLELFFDLAYVLVVAELALTFSKDLSMHGTLVFAGLVTITWWSWVTTTLYANRFDTNDIIYRLAKLGSTAAVMAMAASAQEATGATS